MEYLDFSSVITTIRKYISDAHNMNQIDMMYQLFVSFLTRKNQKTLILIMVWSAVGLMVRQKSALASPDIIWTITSVTSLQRICTGMYFR